MSSANAAPCVGYESNESSVEPTTFQQRATLPRPKQAAGYFGLGDVPHLWTPLVSADHVILSYPGWRSIRYRESRLPWATVFNRFAVVLDKNVQLPNLQNAET